MFALSQLLFLWLSFSPWTAKLNCVCHKKRIVFQRYIWVFPQDKPLGCTYWQKCLLHFSSHLDWEIHPVRHLIQYSVPCFLIFDWSVGFPIFINPSFTTTVFFNPGIISVSIDRSKKTDSYLTESSSWLSKPKCIQYISVKMNIISLINPFWGAVFSQEIRLKIIQVLPLIFQSNRISQRKQT